MDEQEKDKAFFERIMSEKTPSELLTEKEHSEKEKARIEKAFRDKDKTEMEAERLKNQQCTKCGGKNCEYMCEELKATSEHGHVYERFKCRDCKQEFLVR